MCRSSNAKGAFSQALPAACVSLALRRGVAAPSMSIAVFGATGLTGSECTYQALERGYAVRALCRDPSKLTKPEGSCGAAAAAEPIESESLFKYKGSVDSMADVEKIFESGDVEGVVIALGGKTKDVGELRPRCHFFSQMRGHRRLTEIRRTRQKRSGTEGHVRASLISRQSIDRPTDPLLGPTMLTDGTANIIKAMQKYDVKRVAVVTSIGTHTNSA